MPHMPYSDCLYSCGDSYFGYFDDGKFVYNADYTEENNGIRYEIGDTCDAESNVLWINPHPGMEYPKLYADTRAVLLGSYHSGTLCTDSDALKKFAGEAAGLGIPVYLTGAVKGAAYESCREYEKLGIRVLPKASPIAVYIRLWLKSCFKNAYGMGRAVAGDYME